MASSSQTYKFPTGFFAFADTEGGRGERARWELHISFAQIFVLWVFLAGVMLLVFVLGFRKGKDTGLAAALEEYSEQAVRLPVVQPLALSANLKGSKDSASEAAAASGSLAAALPVPADGKAGAKEPQFDFSSNKAAITAMQPHHDPAAVGGSTAMLDIAKKKDANEKPTLELFSGELGKQLTKPKQPEAESEPKPSVHSGEDSTEKVNSGWYVQAAAAPTVKEASSILKKLQESGFPTVSEKAQVRDHNLTRVLVGPYASRDEVTKAKDKLAKAHIGSAQPFVKFIK